jgi:lipoyl(octanoyl) transferase
MASSPICQILVDPPARSTWNMAVDEALLDEAATHGVMTLRLYQWSEPTLSLGYFQPLAERRKHAPSAGCPIVRRSSGGGAILHDRELTYSLAVPATHPLARDAGQLYDAVHNVLIDCIATDEMLGEYGPTILRLWDGVQAALAENDSFLCFERRSDGDIVVQRQIDGPRGHKVVGSAQRRRRGAVLQHGSVLLESSSCAPELMGVNTLTGSCWTLECLAATLAHELPCRLGCLGWPVILDDRVRAHAARLEEEKYDTTGWLARR